jgi:hypothetical protein
MKEKLNMLLSIPEPSRYYCELDEDHFFGWLKSIPAIKELKGTPEGLELIVDQPIDRLSFYELVGLMTRYQLDTRCLHHLCVGHEDAWFNDAENYWYTAVFASAV